MRYTSARQNGPRSRTMSCDDWYDIAPARLLGVHSRRHTMKCDRLSDGSARRSGWCTRWPDVHLRCREALSGE